MKKLSQNDLIIIIVSIVVGLGCIAAFFFTKQETVAVPAPTTVTTAPAAVPDPEVQMTAALSGGTGTMGGFPGGGFPGGGRPGGMPGIPGAPSGFPGAGGRPGGMPSISGGGAPSMSGSQQTAAK